MVKKCSIKLCNSKSYSNCGISFHRFPKNEEMKQRWIEAIPLCPKITVNSIVCSRHFKPSDFCMLKPRPLLKPNAIPTVFPMAKKVLCDHQISNEPVVHRTSSIRGSSDELLSVKNVAVQTKLQRHNSPAEDELKQKVEILLLQLKRRKSRLKKFEPIIRKLKTLI